jgi:hypothetical protein
MNFTDWVAWAAVAVAFVSAFFTALQWASAYRSAAEAKRSADAAVEQATEARRSRELTEKALADQAEALKDQAKLAERSAEAAHRSAAAAEESARLAAQGNRAWVVIDTIACHEYDLFFDRQEEMSGAPPKRIRVEVQTTVKNSGQTVAHDVLIDQELQITKFGPGNIPQFKPLGVTGRAGSLGPADVARFGNKDDIQYERWVEIMEAGQTLSVWGKVEYDDVFKVHHVTSWLYEFQPATKQFSRAEQFNSVT